MSSNKDEFKSNLRFDPTPYIKKDRLDGADGIRPGIAMMRPPTVRIEVGLEERNILAHFGYTNVDEHNRSTCQVCRRLGDDAKTYDTGYSTGFEDGRVAMESVVDEAHRQGWQDGYSAAKDKVKFDKNLAVAESMTHKEQMATSDLVQNAWKQGYEAANTDVKAASDRWRKFGQHEGYKEGIARARAMVEAHLESFVEGIEKGL